MSEELRECPFCGQKAKIGTPERVGVDLDKVILDSLEQAQIRYIGGLKKMETFKKALSDRLSRRV